MSLHIDIFSDVICPWCYIGKKRLDRALEGAAGEGVTMRWQAYQLQPRIPPEGVDRMTFLTSRYGEDADPAKIPSRIAAEAAEEGIEFNYARIDKTPNTFTAHRLLWYAYETAGFEAQHALAERLFEAYFQQGVDVGDIAALSEVAANVGLLTSDVQAFLRSDEGVTEVRAELEQATDSGVSGVPCYFLGGVFPVPGAQTSDVLAQFIERAKSRLA